MYKHTRFILCDLCCFISCLNQINKYVPIYMNVRNKEVKEEEEKKIMKNMLTLTAFKLL